MAPSFVVDPLSEEEVSDEDLNIVFEPPSDEECSDTDEQKDSGYRNFESPWDFAAASERVAAEHALGGTTPVDFKIAKVLQQRGSVYAISHSDSGSDKQVIFYYFYFYIYIFLCWVIYIYYYCILFTNGWRLF